MNIAKEWLKASKMDLDSIEYIINVEHLTPVVSFHAQQSVEFYLFAQDIFTKVSIILNKENK